MTSTAPAPSRAVRAELALAFVCIIWGTTFVVVKRALDDISPALFIAVRFTIGATLLLLVCLLRKPSGPRRWMAGLITGFFLFLGYLLQTAGLKFTTPAKSGFLTALYIVFVPLFAALFYRKPPKPVEWAGVLLAAAGVGLMTLPATGLGDINTGDVMTIGCAVVFAIHILLLSHNSKRMSTEWLAFLQIAACAMFAGVSYRFVEQPFVRWTSPVLVALAITAVFATTLAFLIQTWGQRHTTPTRAVLIFSLEPVFAWLTSYFVENEVLTGRVMVGAACVLAGILLVELKPARTPAAEAHGNLYNQ